MQIYSPQLNIEHMQEMGISIIFKYAGTIPREFAYESDCLSQCWLVPAITIDLHHCRLLVRKGDFSFFVEAQLHQIRYKPEAMLDL